MLKRSRGRRRERAWRLWHAAALVLILWPPLAWGAARALITRASLPRADAIYVLANASTYAERSVRAAELWGEGRAPRVVLTNEHLVSRWSDEHRRNLLIHEWATAELRRAGVPAENVEVLPEPVRNTYEEAVQARRYAARHGLRSLIVVTSAYHSRRALWAFRRVFEGTGVEVGLEAAPPGRETPAPATWWLRPSGWGAVAAEYPKIIYYWVRYRSPGGAAPDVSAQGNAPPITTTGQSANGGTLSVSAPAEAYSGEAVVIDARASAGVAKMPQPNGLPSVTIDFGDGFTCNLLACGHAYRAAGTYTIRVSGKTTSGQTIPEVTQRIAISDIPAAVGLNKNNGAGQNLIDMTDRGGNPAYYIAPSAYGNAAANAVKLQRAIDRAARNNSAEQEIVLPDGAVFAGPIVLTTPSGPNSGARYITIRGAGLGSLPAGRRVGPGARMPTITSPSSTDAKQAAVWTPNPAPAVPSHHYRLQGVRLRKDAEGQPSQALASLGDVNPGQDTVAETPHHFILDRCWLDGGQSDTSQATNGLRVAADHVSVLDSHLAEFRLIGAGVDAAAVSLAKGRGPYAFINNTMVATSENFNSSGGPAQKWNARISRPTASTVTLSSVEGLEVDSDLALPVGGRYDEKYSTVVRSISGKVVTFEPMGAVPDDGGTAEWVQMLSFLEFRRNHLYKPLKWRKTLAGGAPNPEWNGIDYQLKNLWETKGNRYTVIDGNVFENQWIAAQNYAITITPRNITGGESFATVIRELQFSNNVVRNVANGMSIACCDTQYRAGGPTDLRVQKTRGIHVYNNLWQNVGAGWDPHGPAMLVNLLDGFGPDHVRPDRVFFVHNTYDSAGYHITDFGGHGGATDSVWKNNAFAHGETGFRSNYSNQDMMANIIRALPPGDSTVWDRNLIAEVTQHGFYDRRAVVVKSWRAQFVDYGAGDFTLAPSSPGKRAALDGTDIGVDMARLRAATSGATSGAWTDAPAPAPTQMVRPRYARPKKT